MWLHISDTYGLLKQLVHYLHHLFLSRVQDECSGQRYLTAMCRQWTEIWLHFMRPSETVDAD